MKETSGLEVDAVFGSEPYLKGIRRKTVETITKSEEVEKARKRPKRRTLSDLEDLYEKYYLNETPGIRQHKEETDDSEEFGGDIETELRSVLDQYKLNEEQKNLALDEVMSRLDPQVSSYAVGQGKLQLARVVDEILRGELGTPFAPPQPPQPPQPQQQAGTQEIRRSIGDFENDIELADIVNKTMKEKTENNFAKSEELAETVSETMKAEESPLLQWTQLVEPEQGALEEYHAPFENNTVKATVRFYEKTQKSKDHYSVQIEHNSIIGARDFGTLRESRNYLKGQREYDIKKYYGIHETEKPRSALHVLHDAYKKQYDAATDDSRKNILEEKLKKIRDRLQLKDKVKEEDGEEKKVEKTFVDDISPAPWKDLNTIVKMSTYKDDYVKLIEHGIHDKDGNLVDLEALNEYGEYYTREGEKIPSDHVKAVREIVQTGIYSVRGLKHRNAVIV